MAFPSDWLERSDWSRRSPELGPLVRRGHFVGVELATSGGSEANVPERLWELWLNLPAHPNIIPAIDRNVLRYAALDWAQEPLGLDNPDAAVRCAKWGIGLVRAYEHLLRHVKQENLAWFASPWIHVDLEGVVRLAFLGTGKNELRISRLPPEVFDRWPLCDERGLILVIGHALLSRARPTQASTPMGSVLQKCIERDPGRRHGALEDLNGALCAAAGMRVRGHFSPPRPAWDLVETGIGWLAMGETAMALGRFDEALRKDPISRPAALCREEALRRGLDPLAAIVLEELPAESRAEGSAAPCSHAADVPKLSWAEAGPIALEQERQRDFDGALATYQHVIRADADAVSLALGIARCQLQLREIPAAIEHAELALRHSRDHAEAHAILVAALLRARRAAEALQRADAWLALAHRDASAHHARGKCLLALGRVVEARDELVRACELNPQLLEAMLLRRELDRSLGELRASVGTARETAIELPAHLANVRDVLLNGGTSDAIELLRRPEYENDAVAQLLLAGLLSFDGRPLEAIVACDAVVRLDPTRLHQALLAKADALLELDRPAEALVLYDRIRVERSDLVEAIAGRARALLRLNRGNEADAALDEYVAITGNRSDLRVRVTRSRS